MTTSNDSNKKSQPIDQQAAKQEHKDAPAFATLGEDSAAQTESDSCSASELGRKGENAACKFLERKGFTILERNWVCPAGEADIIASIDTEYGSELHFVEVKTRKSTAKGFPEEAVNAEKRRKYEVIAEIYMQQHYCEEARVTFDIISILVTQPDRAFLRMHCDVISNDCF